MWIITFSRRHLSGTSVHSIGVLGTGGSLFTLTSSPMYPILFHTANTTGLARKDGRHREWLYETITIFTSPYFALPRERRGEAALVVVAKAVITKGEETVITQTVVSGVVRCCGSRERSVEAEDVY